MKLQDYFDVSQSGDEQELLRRLVKFAHDMEFPIVTAALVIDSPGPLTVPIFKSLGNQPEPYKKISDDPEMGRRSPVIRRLKTLSVPFFYDRDMYQSEGLENDWEVQAQYGFKTGIAVGLHLPNHRHFLVGVDRSESLPTNEMQLVRMMADLQLLAVHAQSAATRILDNESKKHTNTPRFTPREFEIMSWTMDGKSAWAIGELLSISEATVNFHIRNACAKLDVASKHQAVLKAVNLGLLR